MDIQALLKKVYFFKDFDDSELKRLGAIAQKKPLGSGVKLFNEDDQATSFFIIEFGSIRLYKHGEQGEQEIAILGTGMHFGEMPFLDGEGRALSAVALESTSLYEIPYDKLSKILDADPKLAAHIYKSSAHFLAARLRVVTTDLTYSRERNLKHF